MAGQIEIGGLSELLKQWKEQRQEVQKNKQALIETLRILTEINNASGGKGFKEFVKLQEKSTNTSKELAKQTEQVNAQLKEQERLEKALIKEIAKKELSTESTNRSLQKQKVLNSENNRELKLEAKLNASVDGSLEKVRLTRAKLSKELERTNILTDEGREKAEKLRATIEEQTKFINENSDANRRRIDNIGNYSSAVEDLFPLFGKLQNGLDKISNAPTSFDGISGVFNKIQSSIAGATRQALRFIATPVGAILGIGVAVGSIVKEFFDYNSAISESLKLTQNLTGLSGASLKNFRADVQGLSDTFDADFNEVLTSANTISKNFGLTLDESLNLIEDGFVRGANSGGDYLAQLKEYPSAFREIGFSAEEFNRLILEQQRQGIFDDKLVDAIKESNLALKEFTKSQQDALSNAFGEEFATDLSERISSGATTSRDAILEIGDEADKVGLNFQQLQQLTSDVFKGAGEDAGGFSNVLDVTRKAIRGNSEELTSLQQFTKDLSVANRELAIAKSQALESDSAKEFSNQFKLIWIGIQKFFFDAVSGIRSGVSDLFDGFNSIIQPIKNLISEIPFLNSLFDSLKLGFEKIGGVGNIVSTQFRIFVAILNGIGASITSLIGTFKAFVDSVKGLDFSSFDGFVGSLNNFKDVSLNVGADFKKGFTDSYNSAVEESKKAVEKATQQVKDAEKEQTRETKEQREKRLKEQAEANKKALELAKKKAEDEQALNVFRLEKESEQSEIIFNNEKEVFAKRLIANEEFNQKQIAIIESERDFKLNDATLTEEARILIKEEADKQIEDLTRQSNEKVKELTKSNLDDLFKQAEENTQKILDEINKASEKELQAEQQKLLNKEITIKEFQKREEEIKLNSAKEILSKKLELLELELNNEELTTEQRESLTKQFSETQKSIGEIETNDFITNQQLKEKALRDSLGRISDELGISGETFNAVFDAISGNFETTGEKALAVGSLISEVFGQLAEASIERTEQQIESNEEARALELENANLTSEQKEQIEERFDRKKRQLQRKQAQQQKLADISQATTSTALATIRALGTPPAPNFLLAGLTAGFGALQIAKIISTPIPAFKDGHLAGTYSGTALINDANRSNYQEVIERKDGTAEIYTGRNQLINMEKGDKVFKSVGDYEKTLFNPNFMDSFDLNGLSLKDKIVINNKGITAKEMESVLNRTLKKSRSNNIYIDGMRIAKGKKYFNKI